MDWAPRQVGSDRTGRTALPTNNTTHPPPPRGAPYLARCGVFTQQRFVVGGKDGRVVVDVQHGHQRDALPDLDRILCKRKETRPFRPQLRTTTWREPAGPDASGATSWASATVVPTLIRDHQRKEPGCKGSARRRNKRQAGGVRSFISVFLIKQSELMKEKSK